MASDEPTPESRHPSLKLVAIGASAGGIAALRDFFAEVPESTGATFVVVMHLMPQRESSLAEVLQTACRIPVTQVRGRVAMEPDHVYVIPPDRNLEVLDGHLDISEFAEPRGRRAPIDFFFRSVARVHPDALGVLLSGSGSDGVVGLKDIKEQGGLVLAQSPEEAEQPGMPRSAIATGLVDFVLPATELGEKVVQLRSGTWPPPPPSRVEELQDGDAELLRKILSQLHARTGHDFSGYKRSTVLRRVGRRMQVTQTRELQAYLEELRTNASEAVELMRDLLISVTNFFRDPEAFEALEKLVVPELIGPDMPVDRQVRVWVPGCATGEEAYSIAMLLRERAEALELRPRIQVFATDLDEQALAYAREGLYPGAIAADVREERLRRHFVEEGSHRRVRAELREMILFSRHDLIKDPPFSRLDLVSCRNLLIYLESELQDRVLGIFHYALGEGGRLFLGSSEGIGEQGELYGVVDKAHRIYRRKPDGRSHLHLVPTTPRLRPDVPAGPLPGAFPLRGGAGLAERHRSALEAHAPPSILVDADGTVIHVSETANRYLAFPSGRPTTDLLKVARQKLALPLRALLDHVVQTGAAGSSHPVEMEIEGRRRAVHLWASPADPLPTDISGAGGGAVLVVFLESDGGAASETVDGSGADRHIDALEAELGITRDRLEEMMERSEKRQEELQASNEELQSINEEYKSTLEELETSKEELQSMNEELKTVNDELKEKVDALARANDDLRNLMTATEIPTLFLDGRLRLQRYTPALTDIFNVMAVDEGRPLAHLTHSLDYPGFAEDCERVLQTLQVVERDVREAGTGERHYLARITPYRTEGDRISGVVATFTDITRVRRAQEELLHSEHRFRALVDATAEVVWTTDPQGVVVEDSPSWRAFTGQRVDEWKGREGWLDAVHPDDREEAGRAFRSAIGAGTPLTTEFRIWHASSEEWRFTTVRAVPIRGPDGSVQEWVGMNSDVTERKAAEEELREAKARAEEGDRVKTQFLSTLSHELRTPLNAVIGLSDLLLEEVGGPLTETQEGYVERITRSAWHQLSMIEEILGFSRSEAGRQQVERMDVNVSEVVRHVVEMLTLEAESKGLELRLDLPEEAVLMSSDAGKVRQIVTNLVGNAVRYTVEGRVEVALAVEDDEVRVVVSDTGPGIPEGRMEDIFEPFVQIREGPYATEGGTGLGLSVSRRLARALGGEVEVESAPGEGSRFTFRLPRKNDQTSTEA